MGDATDPPDNLIQGLRDGDPKAADEVFARYAQKLTRFAEQHLSAKLAGRLDGSDVVQSVFRTFFRRSAEGEFRIDSTAQLWQLLVKITLLKARAKARHHTAEIRDVGAEADADGEPWLVEAVTHDPGPLEALILVDQIETLLPCSRPAAARVWHPRDRLPSRRLAADRPPGAPLAPGAAGARVR
jgi:ECF sigma factor